MKITKKRVIVGAVIIAVLAAVFWWGGNAPELRGWNPNEPESTQSVAVNDGLSPESNDGKTDSKPVETPIENKSEETANGNPDKPGKDADSGQSEPPGQKNGTGEKENKPSESENAHDDSNFAAEYKDSKIIKTPQDKDDKTGKSKDNLKGMYDSEGGKNGDIPNPVNSEDAKITSEKKRCTLTVKCSTILDNIDMLKPEKRSLVPDNGIIFPEKEVMFYEGESVFNVLLREMKRAGIHLEYVNTPIYKSAYIEGINNLYEFDCGELSGWIYRVNGLKPDYGCSRYPLSDGDRIEFDYTCNLGNDIR